MATPPPQSPFAHADASGSPRDEAPLAVDPRRLRSAGPLEPDEIALCRANGVALAYDPVQIGWVPADCVDDFDLDLDPGLDPGLDRADANASTPSVLLRIDEWTKRFDAEADQLLGDAPQTGEGASETADRLWSLASELASGASELGPIERLAALRAVQRRAHARITERLVSPEERGRLRHAALIGGRDYLLRPWRPDDVERFRALLDDPEVWRHLPEPYPAPLSEEMAGALIELSNHARHHEVRAIERDGEVVGQIRLLFDGPHDASKIETHGTNRPVDAEISYWLGRQHWGQGIAGAVIRLFTLLAFQKRPLASIFARVDEANTASRRALEKAGYRDEGDLAAELAGASRIRTLRCFRADYLEVESDLDRGDASRPPHTHGRSHPGRGDSPSAPLPGGA